MRSHIAYFVVTVFFCLARVSLGEQFTPFAYNESEVYRLIFSPNDNRFAIIAAPTTEGGTPRLIVADTKTGRTLLDTQGRAIANPCFDHEGKYIAVFIGVELAVFDLRNGMKVFSKGRLDVFGGSSVAMGFTRNSSYLVLEKYDAFGFSKNQNERLVFTLPSGNSDESVEDASFWYGDNLASDGQKWFGGGVHGPTPRVLRRNGDYIGHCLRLPNIGYAWFARNSESLITLHTDGALFLWNFADVDKTKSVRGRLLSNSTDLLEFTIIVPLNSTDSFVVIEKSGQLSTRKIPY